MLYQSASQQSHSRLLTEEKKNDLILRAVNEFSLAYVENTGMMRRLERDYHRSSWGSSKTLATGVSFRQVFQAGMRAITSNIVAKE